MVLVALTSACTASSGNAQTSNDPDAAVAVDPDAAEPDAGGEEPAMEIPSASGESAFTFNADPFKATNAADAYECIYPRDGSNTSTPARFFGGTTALFSWRSVDFIGTTCLPGQLRIARWERLTINGERAYIMRGGGGTNADEIYGNTGIRFAHVYASDLAKDTSVITSFIPGKVGNAPASCAGPLYKNDPKLGTTAELSTLYYKPNQPAASGAKWDNYGDQAGTGPTPYNYVLWTWPVLPSGANNDGGGQIRTVISAGDAIRTCDVAPVYLPMYPAGSSVSVGRFKMMYGRVRNTDDLAYGWFAAGWQRTDGPWHNFVRP